MRSILLWAEINVFVHIYLPLSSPTLIACGLRKYLSRWENAFVHIFICMNKWIICICKIPPLMSLLITCGFDFYHQLVLHCNFLHHNKSGVIWFTCIKMVRTRMSWDVFFLFLRLCELLELLVVVNAMQIIGLSCSFLVAHSNTTSSCQR